MPTASEIRVSIDVGSHRHSVAIGLPTGEVLEEFDLLHRPEGFDLLFAHVERYQRRYGGEVAVAMEGYNGWARPLDTLVRRHGYRLFNINHLKLARFKEIFPAAAKNDRIDARKGLELFQLCDHLPVARGVLQEVAATPLENRDRKKPHGPSLPHHRTNGSRIRRFDELNSYRAARLGTPRVSK